jgi:coenzyme PQQ synthesis protein D (PqqD)
MGVVMSYHEINVDSVVCRTSDVVFSKLDDELLAIDAQAGYCYSMNETAGRIWEMISVPVSVGELCSQMRTEFFVDELMCRQEILTLLKGLLESGLIQVKDAQTHSE